MVGSAARSNRAFASASPCAAATAVPLRARTADRAAGRHVAIRRSRPIRAMEEGVHASVQWPHPRARHLLVRVEENPWRHAAPENRPRWTRDRSVSELRGDFLFRNQQTSGMEYPGRTSSSFCRHCGHASDPRIRGLQRHQPTAESSGFFASQIAFRTHTRGPSPTKRAARSRTRTVPRNSVRSA